MSGLRLWLAGALALVVGVVTAYLVWPPSARLLASSAVQELRAWRGVDHAGVVVDGNGLITSLRMTVTSDGTAHGVLSRGNGAVAEVAVSPDRMLLRGNREWWLHDMPGSAESLAGTWIADPPGSVTGLLPTAVLTPAELAVRVSGSTNDQWTQAGTTSVGGRAARVLTNGAHQILVSDSSPHRPLSISLALDHRGTPPPPVQPTSSQRGSGKAKPPVGLTTAISEASDAQIESAAAAVKRLGEAQHTPPQLSERITIAQEVAVDLRNESGNPCTTPTCTSTVTVTNAGPGTASGTLMVSVAGQAVLNTPIVVPPGGRRSYPATAVNAAPADTSIPVVWVAVLHNAAVMGDDPELAKRVYSRGIDINKSVLADVPNSKAILQLLDAMTPDITANTDDRRRKDRIRDATSTISDLIRHRALGPFFNLVVQTDNLKVTDSNGVRELAENAATLSAPQEIRVLRHAEDLALADHTVIWNTTYRPSGSGKGYRAPLLDLTTRQTFVEKVVTGHTTEVEHRLKEAVRQLSGDITPPGFAKVAQIDIEPDATTPLAFLSRGELLAELRELDLHRHCAPAGEPVVDRVVITNYPRGPDGVPKRMTNVFACVDLQAGSTTDEQRQVHDEHIWKANNDPSWRAEHYQDDGHRRSIADTEYGFLLPVLTKSTDNTWISRDAMPPGKAPVRVDRTELGRGSVPADKVAALDKVALDRWVAARLTNAQKASGQNLTEQTTQELTAAQQAYRKQLGDRPNNSKIAEELGEQAAELHVIPTAFPGANRVELPKPANGARSFDQLYRFDDGRLLIVEAKAPSGGLTCRQGAGPTQGIMVCQGTAEYIHTIIHEMRERGSKSAAEARLAAELSAAMAAEKVQYVLVQAAENTGTYTGAVLEHFKIF
ncbi:MULTISPECIES: hypothetical protein [unclassified Crossiella]|uniref:hypothetical protein n=1 Tax=unclassified Crossiella TaxID=2620835 RepID=UPI001FFE802F|nr:MULTISPECIES: hypothetical protein [unclassified Crossiella]MCK2245442.1 hypothetical protein [Crossiella sp. S99.2]MCK2259094.1 hypothetical protein [Crossiella sp. S99.1]